MVDRRAADLFYNLFTTLAEGGPLDRRAFAAKVWEWLGEFDFHWAQLGCDEALIKLGLAERCPKCWATLYRGTQQERDHAEECKGAAL